MHPENFLIRSSHFVIVFALCFLIVVFSFVERKTPVHAQTFPCPNSKQLAFPTAEGFGACAKGGRGGKVIYVTNTNTSGTGSFRACLEATGPRTCIFRVGGIIDWPIESPTINPYLTIAGQTAPGDGIMIKGLQLQMGNTHDIVVRHLRVRPGDNVPVPGSWGAIETFNSHDIIIDHCSAGWATDDTVGGSNSSYNVTFQWCLVSEGLGLVGASKVGLWDYTAPMSGISHLHNLLAHHNYRVPSMSAGSLQMVNNVVYNTYLGSQIYPVRSAVNAEFVNNYYLRGPNSHSTLGTAITAVGCGYDKFVNCTHAANSKIYLKGNYHNALRTDDSQPETKLLFQLGNPDIPVITTPFDYFPTLASVTTAQQARTDVLKKAGAIVPKRDSIDTRAVNDVKNGTGRMIKRVSEVGGYPTYNSGTPYPDADMDGMDDTWETSHGLNPNNASDGALLAPNGYTHLENYLNELAGDPIPGNPYGGGTPTPSPTPTSPTPIPTPEENPVAHWTFDEASGTTALDSAGNNTATLLNGATRTTGRIGSSALSLDGVNDLARGSAVTNLPLSGPLTITAWIKPSVLPPSGSYGHLFVAGTAGSRGYGLNLSGSILGFVKVGVVGVNSTVSIAANVWQHVAVSWIPSTNAVAFYKDGVLQQTVTNTATANPLIATDRFTIGSWLSETGSFYSGAIDDLRLYNRALSVDEIQTIYSGAKQMPELRADLNKDGTVNSLDWSIMNAQWGGSEPADLNKDGIVNSLDFSILNSNWGKTI